MLLYFTLSRFLLGNLNYRIFSDYENELQARKDLLVDKKQLTTDLKKHSETS